MDGAWSSFRVDSFELMIATRKPYVLMAQNLSRSDGVALFEGLKGLPHFLGALEIDNRRGVHWAIYVQKLPHGYRVVGRELRLLYGHDQVALEDNRGHDTLRRWKRSGLYDSVLWENVGVRFTIMDEYDTPQLAARTAKTEAFSVDHLEQVATEIATRTFDLDPKMVEALHAAFTTLQSAERRT